MANVCTDMVENHRFDNDKTNMFCLRASTGYIKIAPVTVNSLTHRSIVLVDHIDDFGAFHKKSVINVCIICR